MAYDDMMGLLDNADPQTLQLMLQALNSGESMGLGHEMFGAPQPTGQNVGRTYVAASPLEHLSNAMTRAQGLQMMRQGQQQRAGGIQAYIDALRQGRTPKPVDPMYGAQFANEMGAGD